MEDDDDDDAMIIDDPPAPKPKAKVAPAAAPAAKAKAAPAPGKFTCSRSIPRSLSYPNRFSHFASRHTVKKPAAPKQQGNLNSFFGKK